MKVVTSNHARRSEGGRGQSGHTYGPLGAPTRSQSGVRVWGLRQIMLSVKRREVHQVKRRALWHLHTGSQWWVGGWGVSSNHVTAASRSMLTIITRDRYTNQGVVCPCTLVLRIDTAVDYIHHHTRNAPPVSCPRPGRGPACLWMATGLHGDKRSARISTTTMNNNTVNNQGHTW